MSNDDRKMRAREIAGILVEENYTIYKELGELVLELIEEPEAPTIKETGWKPEYEGMIAIDQDGDEAIILDTNKTFVGDPIYRALWKNSLDRLIILEYTGASLRPTGRYANASSVLKNKGEQE